MAGLCVYLIAGEPSGDALGAALMAGLKQRRPDVIFRGVGGPKMAAEGLRSLFAMEELSVMGLAEVLPRLRGLLRRRDEVASDILTTAPDVLITIDSPDFCLRVARKVKAARPDQMTVHYVAPTVWAWRPKRARKMLGVIDHVLALFPFEPPLMQEAGLGCDFVGHPVVTAPVADAAAARAFRDKHGIGKALLILVLPGSRRGEVTRLTPIFGAALKQLLKKRPTARVVLPAAEPVADTLRGLVKGWPGRVILLDPRGRAPDIAAREKSAAFAAADVALAASGTVSLELAASETPMVVAYDMNWISRQMIKHLLLIDTVTLVNLVSETRAVPEFLGKACTPTEIAGGLEAVLSDETLRVAQQEAARITMQRLGRDDEPPGLRAADAVLRLLGDQSSVKSPS